MAICNELQISIGIGGQLIREYDPPEHEVPTANKTDQTHGPVTRKFVEAQAGQNFVLACRIPADFEISRRANALGFDVFLDGMRAGGWCAPREEFQGKMVMGFKKGRQAWTSAGMHIEKYQFSVLEITDESPHTDLAVLRKQHEAQGTIRVVVLQRCIRKSEPSISKIFVNSNQSTPEKALKGRAVTLASGLGPAEPVETSRDHYFCAGSNVGVAPVATFIFEYRTRKALQELMIIERSPTPIPLAERDEDSLPEADLRQLVRELKARAAVHSADVIKRPQEDESKERLNDLEMIVEPQPPVVKREHRSIISDNIEEIQISKKPRVHEDVIEIDSD